MAIIEDIEAFKREWDDKNTSTMLVHTSGSTGKPKPFLAAKEQMINSARITCDFLGLKKGDNALLCMPLKYIAGKMVVVRSIVRGLNLIAVEPSGHPLKEVEVHLHFAAMTPMQIYNTLQDERETEKLREIENLIIGGGAIDEEMGNILKTFPNKVYSTYGMTETLSHIAMRRLNGEEASEWYTTLEGVKTGLSEEGTLIIDAPHLHRGRLITNDIAEIGEDGRFRIKGRRDNTINSGGIKVQTEEVEKLLKQKISNFAISSAKDAKFGEIIVLATEDDETTDEELMKICREALPKLWVPKSIVHCKIPQTATGKIARKELADIINQRVTR